MKHNLHKLMAMFVACIFAVNAFAQTDVTSQYLQNAGFDDQSSWLAEGNVDKQAIEVAGWTAISGGEWCYGAAFAYGSQATVNNAAVPATNADGVAEGGVLGLSVGWGLTIQYTQDVVFPAGVYTLTYKAINVNADATQASNLIGFKSEKASYYGKNTNFAVNTWVEESVTFVLKEETEGAISVGIGAISGGSGANAKLFIDDITLSYDPELPEEEPMEIGDVTSKYLVNADFETPSAQNGGAINTPPGWTMTYDLGGWLDGSTRLSENPGNDASQCFNVWAGEFRSADIYQKPVLPAGKYKLTVGFYSDGAAERYAYATVGGTTVKSATPTPGSWDFVDVEFLNPTEGEVVLGAISKGWFQIDNVTLEYLGEVNKDDFVSAYNEALEKAKALMGQKMDGTASTELAAAIAAYGSLTADNSVEELESATAAISVKVAAAETSANAYANNKAAIDAMFALLESTNVYTAEACATYTALAEEYLAQYEAGTLEDVVDNPAAIHGWHASVDYDDLLLSAFGTNNFDTNLYINTWSNEGESDGSDFKVPFYEYWTGDGESLGVATKTATVAGLTPSKSYEVEAWVRVRAKNGVAAADATGITLSVGDGEAVDVTEGEVVGESQFAHAVYTAVGKADAEGNLIINFTVADDNNVSWLSFKNIKYAEYGGETAVESVESQAEAVIYDLSGRRVQKMTKGLYIVNGRKVIK